MCRRIKRIIAIKLSLFIALIVFANPSHAMTKGNLLHLEDRPTMQEIKKVARRWSKKELEHRVDLPKYDGRPEPDYLQNNYPLWFSHLEREAAQVIATFEYSFPGAQWVFMGRDMMILADLFESFYMQLGQEDRVVRLGMRRLKVARRLELEQMLCGLFLRTTSTNVNPDSKR